MGTTRDRPEQAPWALQRHLDLNQWISAMLWEKVKMKQSFRLLNNHALSIVAIPFESTSIYVPDAHFASCARPTWGKFRPTASTLVRHGKTSAPSVWVGWPTRDELGSVIPQGGDQWWSPYIYVIYNTEICSWVGIACGYSNYKRVC